MEREHANPRDAESGALNSSTATMLTDPAASAFAGVAGIYYFELLGTAVFAVTGVLAVARRGLDIFGALVLGLVTAIGGGTARDVMIRAPIFWIEDFNYVWAALIGALLAFWIGPRFSSTHRTLLYLDGLGAALFAVTATNKVLLLRLGAPTAVIMGVLTAIGGGIVRDVWAGRPTLLMSREIYATPILLGCTVFVWSHPDRLPFGSSGLVAVVLIFGIRALAIHRHLEIPHWLTHRRESGSTD
jgi:uncharacterized membrane protein YeiH